MAKLGYLTIDNAPSEEFKQKVDFLISKKIPAIFFCRGNRLEERKEDAVYAIKKGFIIGNHTYSHPHCSKLSKDEVFDEIYKTDKLIDEVYKIARVKRPIKVFRFSYGDKGFGDNFEDGSHTGHSKAIQEFLRKLDYKQPSFKNINLNRYKNPQLENDADVIWTYDTHDWRLYSGLDTLPGIFQRMEESSMLNSKDSDNVILMHDFPNTFELFKQIIERLLGKGIKFEMPKF